MLSYQHLRWVEETPVEPKKLKITSDTKVVQDFKDNYLLLFTDTWNINWALDKNEGLRLAEFSR